jgi:hypothetical protein
MPISKAFGYSVRESCLRLVQVWLKRRWLSATQTRVISRIDFAGIRELLRASIGMQCAEFSAALVLSDCARLHKILRGSISTVGHTPSGQQGSAKTLLPQTPAAQTL